MDTKSFDFYVAFDIFVLLLIGIGPKIALVPFLDVTAGMDAATKAVTLQVQLAKPMYPLEIYVKPMTSLVWLGTAIMTMGGFMSAYYRRVARKVAVRTKIAESGELEVLKRPLIPI